MTPLYLICQEGATRDAYERLRYGRPALTMIQPRREPRRDNSGESNKKGRQNYLGKLSKSFLR